MIKALELELLRLEQEKDVLSYKKYWTGEDFERNREIADKIYRYEKALKILKGEH